MARLRAPLSAGHAADSRPGARDAAAGGGTPMAERALHRERRPRRAAEGGARNRRRDPAIGGQSAHQLRRARPRHRGRPRCGSGHRKGHDCLQFRRARGRRLVTTVLPQSRDHAAATEGARLGDANLPGRERARGLAVGARLWSTQAPRRRLQRRPWQPDRCRHRARQHPFHEGFLAGLARGAYGAAPASRQAVLEELALPARWPLDRQSPFERVRVLDPAPSPDLLDAAATGLRAAFPAFKDARIEERWAGYIDVTPDAVPVISPVEQLPGFFVATGFSGHGFGIGPGAGRLMADLVTGAPPIVDPTPYRFARFSDGSKVEVIAGF